VRNREDLTLAMEGPPGLLQVPCLYLAASKRIACEYLNSVLYFNAWLWQFSSSSRPVDRYRAASQPRLLSFPPFIENFSQLSASSRSRPRACNIYWHEHNRYDADKSYFWRTANNINDRSLQKISTIFLISRINFYAFHLYICVTNIYFAGTNLSFI